MRWYMKKRRTEKCKKSAHKQDSQEAKTIKGKTFRTGVVAGSDPKP